MPLEEHYSLKKHNTFGVEACARYFAPIRQMEELEELLIADLWKSMPTLVLGEGSNILFTRDVDGLVLKNEIKGIAVIRETADEVWLKVGGGENWHRFVMFCVGNQYAGVENLALIPGSVGASPVQNIGAYGVEVKEVIEKVVAWHLETHELLHFSNADCAFGYRDSVFKHAYQGRLMIVWVVFRLSKHPVFHTEYAALREELERMGVKTLSLKAISEAVIRIRTRKLPDPAKIGNAGSFFKNPQIPLAQYQALKQQFPDLPSFPVHADSVKIPAAWLIEQCGWKGYREGDAGVHSQQALVLVNYGKATGKQILDLSERIRQSVHERFGVWLEREVNVW
ncbi:UDP-N-acetylmuramate dehydrogenase [Thermoflavifilum aggregans]|uniref:UDP-N-acetylenolpyruvoylglucosamine reductase n=1 Tax=Thermoflavifilum aggregans TaxID=454188 RepID=A0A2M9CUM8_9BACT|nr:UDP-N-acetylmuramate dehydrogenase [Thermoflavifilum aggregans]MBX6381161.1 UDP-N-acetylmuramate dehydrogenase [Thermoflavifilum aggregans]PJJ75624.1 UDP-N-acetylmuramate dehydrogenase [Thermoflavifilum aggregans]